MLGFGQLLEQQDPTDEQRPRIKHILDAGRHLLKLTNEVLDIYRAMVAVAEESPQEP